MKTLIVFFSMRGHTKKAAQLIADTLGSDITLVELKYQGSMAAMGQEMNAIQAGSLEHFEFDHSCLDLAQYDRVFIGVPVYGAKPAPAFDAFLKNCKNGKGKEWVVFATCGMAAGGALGQMKAGVEQAGGRVAGAEKFATAFGLRTSKVKAFAQALR